MEWPSRDAFDTGLIVVGLVLVYSHAVSTTDPSSLVGVAVSALVSLDPLVYLVVLGVAGILFMAYGLLYLPGQASQ
jgi:hypothetical protein